MSSGLAWELDQYSLLARHQRRPAQGEIHKMRSKTFDGVFFTSLSAGCVLLTEGDQRYQMNVECLATFPGQLKQIIDC
jgi:hypothetical protein